MAESVRLDIIAGPEDRAVVLAGPPSRLTGTVEFLNRGDADIVIRDAILSDPSGVLTRRNLRLSLSTFVLRPKEEKRLELSFGLDPMTPPGEYHVELEIGGRSRPAILYIAEVLDLTLSPQSIVVLNQPDVPQRKQIVVTNDGNVAIVIGEIGEVDLQDDLLVETAERLRLEPLIDLPDPEQKGRAPKGPALALVRIGRPGGYREDGLFVRRVGDPVTIAPGSTMPVEWDITLQEELRPNSRYRGKARILTSDLEIVVVSSGGFATSSPQAKSRAKSPVSADRSKKQGGKR